MNEKYIINGLIVAGGKLSWNWGGPYVIVEQTKRGTYHLKTTKGKVLKTAVSSNRLKLHYEGIQHNICMHMPT